MNRIKQIFETLILKATHRLWNRRVSAILCRAYNDGKINSEQLHELAAKFDPTQAHAVYDNPKKRSQRFRMAACAVVAFILVAIVAADASACTRCGLFGRRCRFFSGHVDAVAVTPYVAATPQTLVIQNNLNAPNGAAAFLAPQGQSVYGLAQAAQPYYLDPSAVLRQAAELTKGAQQLAQQGLTGYNQTASLALTLQASQPAIQAAALTVPQQLNTGRSVSQTIKLTQNASGQWTVEAGSSENQGGGEGGAPTQPAVPPSPLSDPQPEAPGAIPSGGQSLVAKHCASCHGLDKSAPKGGLFYDGGHKLDCGPSLKAIQSVMSGKMPKGVQLTPEEKGELIRELATLGQVGQ